jgi:hypothetical protein
MSDQLHAMSLNPRKESLRYLWVEQEAGWAPELVWTLWRRDKYFAPARNRTPAVQPVAHRYADRTIPAPFQSSYGTEISKRVQTFWLTRFLCHETPQILRPKGNFWTLESECSCWDLNNVKEVSRDVTPCIPSTILKMQAAYSYAMLVYIYQIALCRTPE